MAKKPMSAWSCETASTDLAAVSNTTSSTDRPSRRPNSRARSTETPRTSPVAASLAARMGLPRLIEALKRPLGAKALAMESKLLMGRACRSEARCECCAIAGTTPPSGTTFAIGGFPSPAAKQVVIIILPLRQTMPKQSKNFESSPQHALARRRSLVLGIGAAAALGGCALQTAAPARMERMRVKIFPGAQNLALYAGIQQGFFARRGVEVDLQFTPNSVELRNGLAAGTFEVAYAAVDNAVAMREAAGQDVVILTGGDNSMNELFVQPDIASIDQLRGRTLIVDAPNTAYALQAKKILKDRGLQAGDYTVKQVGGTFQRIEAMRADRSNSASTLNPPYSLQAVQSGLRSLGKVRDLLGPYQASGAFAMRPWAEANGDLLERYLAAWIEGTRWSLD